MMEEFRGDCGCGCEMHHHNGFCERCGHTREECCCERLYGRRNTRGISELVDSLREIKKGLCELMESEREIKRGLCEVEKDLECIRVGLCGVEKARDEIQKGVCEIEDGMCELLKSSLY